jgi:Secretion system C-terminal sorting domain
VLKRTTNTQNTKPPYPTVFSYVTTWIKGDTSIAGIPFKKVFHREFSPGANIPIYQGAIREEGQVVSWIPSGQGLNRSDTLYNFNVEVGDTVAYYRDMSPYYLYVGKIDSITLNDNIKRKRISIYVDFVGTPEIEQNPVNSWVEGFGEMRFGLIYPFCFSSNPRCGDEFRCYKEDNSIIYESSLFACYESNTQTFLPFPTKNAEWSRVVTVVGDYDPVYITSHYVPRGDTVIKNKVFTKLYVNTGKAFRIDSAQYVGAYINESNRVFFIDKGELSPRLLYDFNLPVGWIGESSPNCNPNALRCVLFRLASIDTVVYDDQVKRARFNFEIGRKPDNGVFMGSYAYSWIEGIGSTLGFFPDLSNTMFVPVTPQVFLDLLCFKQNDTLLYTHPRLYKGKCFVDIVDDVKTIDDPITINIYPNPASDQLFIQHDLNLNKSTSIILLMDVMGRVVLQKPLDASLIQLDVANLSPGIYFVQIRSKEGQINVSKKIIKSY